MVVRLSALRTGRLYLLTPWCRVVLEEELVKKFPTFHGTRRFITALTSVRLYPKEIQEFWYSFLLEAESTPGPQCDRKDFMSMKNFNDTIWDRTSDLPVCSTAP